MGNTLANEQNLFPAGSRSLREMLEVESSAFDVANAITATAREKSIEARLTMEEVGHRYLASRV